MCTLFFLSIFLPYDGSGLQFISNNVTRELGSCSQIYIVRYVSVYREGWNRKGINLILFIYLFFFLKGVLVHIGSLVSSEFPNLMKMRKMILASTWYFSVFHSMPQIFLSHLMILWILSKYIYSYIYFFLLFFCFALMLVVRRWK